LCVNDGGNGGGCDDDDDDALIEGGEGEFNNKGGCGGEGTSRLHF